MKAREEVVETSGRRSSFTTVRNFLGGLNGRKPTKEEVATISDDLEELYKRVEKVHSIAPELVGVEMSDDIYELLRLAGRKVGVSKRRTPFGKAASFL